MIDFILPAHNEESTVGAVVLAVRQARATGLVLVVADDCDDRTVPAASQAGAAVIEITERDKGTAMAIGLAYVQTSRVGFIDTDLIGLRPEHIDALASEPPNAMAVGVRDSTLRLPLFPPIGGERVLPTTVAAGAGLMGSSYMAEMRLATAAKRYGVPTIGVRLPGLGHLSRARAMHLKRWPEVAAGWLDYLIVS